MKLHTLILFISLWLVCYGCDSRTLETMTPEQINEILSHINEDDPAFVQKEVVFDSIVTSAGTRNINDRTERVKSRLYYFGDRTRGYFNLADRDEKNLQVFGKKINNRWVIKCVTKLNMEEVGCYMIMNPNGQGIWSNGHINFKTEQISLKKQNIDYDDLKTW